MPERPSADQLLAGVSRFLSDDLPGAVADPGLRYRLKVAAHLVELVRRELAADPRPAAAEALAALLPLAGAEIEAEEAVAAGIRGGELAGPELEAAVRALLKARLQLSNPRFDLSDDLP